MLFILIGISHSVFAKDVHKCTVNGAVIYQAKPCAGTIKPSKQLQMQRKLAERTASQNAKMGAFVHNQTDSQFTTQQNSKRLVGNGTTNTILDTVEEKKKNLVNSDDVYRMTKNN